MVRRWLTTRAATRATQYKFDWTGADGGGSPTSTPTVKSVAASPEGIHTIYVDPNGGNRPVRRGAAEYTTTGVPDLTVPGRV